MTGNCSSSWRKKWLGRALVQSSQPLTTI